MLVKRIIGNKELRDKQLEALVHVCSGKNAIINWPTSYGKSLIYQVAALHFPGIVLVVGPIIALMQDSVEQCKKHGIRAVVYNSETPPKEIEDIKNQIALFTELGMEPDFKVMFIAPERLHPDFVFNDSILQPLHTGGLLSALFLDEVHAASTWTFRNNYRTNQFVTTFAKVPRIAMTATLTPFIEADIRELYHLEDAVKFAVSPNRPNIHYSVVAATRLRTSVEEDISIFLNQKFSSPVSGLIFAWAKDTTKDVCERLEKLMPTWTFGIYHADISAAQKVKLREQWMTGKLHVMVCTIAFGMGINHPHVRFVVHYNMPDTIEGFQQESGRGGRDGELSYSRLYFEGQSIIAAYMKNFGRELHRLQGKEETQALYNLAKNKMKKGLKAMVDFCEATTCRRQILYRYFGDGGKVKCNRTCDVCAFGNLHQSTLDACLVASSPHPNVQHPVVTPPKPTKKQTTLDSLLLPMPARMSGIVIQDVELVAEHISAIPPKKRRINDLFHSPFSSTSILYLNYANSEAIEPTNKVRRIEK